MHRMYESMHKLTSSDQVKAILNAAESQDQQSDRWSVSLNTIMVEEQHKILDSLTAPTKCVTINDLKKKQQSERWIVEVKGIVKKTTILTPVEIKNEPPDAQQLLKQQSKLSINDNGLLCRKSNDYHHII